MDINMHIIYIYICIRMRAHICIYICGLYGRLN